jgi:WhiB family transcriptional regulator, redox-sensing transcriptional regulator
MEKYADLQKAETRLMLSHTSNLDVMVRDAGKHDDDDWMKQAECSDKPPNMFFPNNVAGVNAAKLVCAECIVRTECLEYAIDKKVEAGVWGGTSERERHVIIKQRKESVPN